MMITSPKKTGLNLKKSTWEYRFSWFMTGLKIKLITKKERKKEASLFPAPLKWKNKKRATNNDKRPHKAIV